MLDCFLLYWSKTLTQREMLSCIGPQHLPTGKCSLVMAPDTYPQGNALLYWPPTLTHREMLSCISPGHLPTGKCSLVLAPDTYQQGNALSCIGPRHLPTGRCSLVLAPDTYPQGDALLYWLTTLTHREMLSRIGPVALIRSNMAPDPLYSIHAPSTRILVLATLMVLFPLRMKRWLWSISATNKI